jgi:hypothetical protein
MMWAFSLKNAYYGRTLFRGDFKPTSGRFIDSAYCKRCPRRCRTFRHLTTHANLPGNGEPLVIEKT